MLADMQRIDRTVTRECSTSRAKVALVRVGDEVLPDFRVVDGWPRLTIPFYVEQAQRSEAGFPDFDAREVRIGGDKTLRAQELERCLKTGQFSFEQASVPLNDDVTHEIASAVVIVAD